LKQTNKHPFDQRTINGEGQGANPVFVTGNFHRVDAIKIHAVIKSRLHVEEVNVVIRTGTSNQWDTALACRQQLNSAVEQKNRTSIEFLYQLEIRI